MISRQQLEDALFEQAADYMDGARLVGGRAAMELQCTEAGVRYEDLQDVGQRAAQLVGEQLPPETLVAVGFLLCDRATRERSRA